MPLNFDTLHRLVPARGLERTVRLAYERRGGTVRRRQRCKRFPTLRAGHAQIDRVIHRGSQVHRHAFFEMHVERTAGGTKAAHDPGGRVRLQTRRHMAQTEGGGL